MTPGRPSFSWALFLLIPTSCLLALGVSVGWRPVVRPDQSDAGLQLRQENARREEGLRAAAAVTGTYIGKTSYPSVGGPTNLAELVGLSSVIIVGSPEGNVCRPTADGSSIITIYKMSVETVLKGKVPRKGSVSMIVLGGRIGFPDGSWAQLNTPGLKRPRTGYRMAAFLREAPGQLVAGNERFLSDGTAYVPAGGPLGMYDLSPSGGAFVQPAGHHQSELSINLHKERLGETAFLDQIRRSVGSSSFLP